MKSDEELMADLFGDRENVTDIILERYKDLVRKKAASMYIPGADRDDLIQEGMIGLFKAIRDFDASKEASFRTFADLCISRQMYTAIESSARKKNMPLNNYVSIYSADSDGEGESEALEAKYENHNAENPEQRIIDQENAMDIQNAIDTYLSSFERDVMNLYIKGNEYSEIAKLLGKDEKSTDNALQRGKSKLRKYVKI
ncbi:MAG: sigma-70 family RNA polymerase sigma factor [Butyrivibrio sp.]|nr:sigma-70 family RNA polymerase sigma factor [Butyrivibrio sp.]